MKRLPKPMTVQNTIKAFIENRKISVYRFRQDIGVAQSTAYDLVNNPDRIPNADVLNKICEAYQIQPGAILSWVPDKEPVG
jgi:DNA-binding Xre family transcriptional regulator